MIQYATYDGVVIFGVAYSPMHSFITSFGCKNSISVRTVIITGYSQCKLLLQELATSWLVLKQDVFTVEHPVQSGTSSKKDSIAVHSVLK